MTGDSKKDHHNARKVNAGAAKRGRTCEDKGEICPTCNVMVTDDRHSISCNLCLKCFHRECAGVSAALFDRIGGNDRFLWHCKPCRESGATEDFSYQLKALTKDVESLRGVIRTSVAEAVGQELGIIKSKLVDHDERILRLEAGMNELKRMSGHVQWLDSHARRHDIMVYGVPVCEKDTMKFMSSIFAALEIVVGPGDIAIVSDSKVTRELFGSNSYPFPSATL